MKKVHSIAIMGFCLLTMVAATNSYAGNRAGAGSGTLGIGYDFFAAKRRIQNTGVPLVGLGYSFTDRWGIEGLLGIFNTNFKNSVNDQRQIDGTLVLVDGIYHFAPMREFIEPHLLAGVGAMGMNPSRSDANNEGNINAGAGVELFIHPSIAFRFDARDIYTWVGGKNDIMLDAGITFLFGGNK